MKTLPASPPLISQVIVEHTTVARPYVLVECIWVNGYFEINLMQTTANVTFLHRLKESYMSPKIPLCVLLLDTTMRISGYPIINYYDHKNERGSNGRNITLNRKSALTLEI